MRSKRQRSSFPSQEFTRFPNPDAIPRHTAVHHRPTVVTTDSSASGPLAKLSYVIMLMQRFLSTLTSSFLHCRSSLHMERDCRQSLLPHVLAGGTDKGGIDKSR
ncbi:hypothetical protein Mapa_001004 [Marchantia paleacea]|nr:hypothetical protein Mapa_001004 [Marchantia paleacea]